MTMDDPQRTPPPVSAKVDSSSLATSQLGLVLGAVCIAFAPVLVKTLGDLGPTVTGMYRTATGAVFLFLIYAWRQFRRRGDVDRKLQSRLLDERPQFVAWCVFAGVLFALDLYVWHRSVLLVGAGMGTILGNTQVFYLALMGSVFLGERLDLRYAVAVPLAFVGITLLVTMGTTMPHGADYWFGVGCGLATGVVYASYLLVLRRLQTLTNQGPVLILALISSVTAVVLAIVAMVEGSLRYPSPEQWWPILGLGLVPQVIGWSLISRYLPRLEVSRSGLILLLQPALATIFGALFFAESLSGRQLGGAGLTLFAVYLGSTRQVRRQS